MKKFLLLIIFIFVLLASCGKKGPLVPPEALAPAPVADLKVEQKGERLYITWTRTTREEGGREMKGLAGFRLYRREVLPPGEDCEECANAYRLLANIDLEYPQGVMIQKDRYIYQDSDAANGKTYRYKVVSLKKDGTTSRDSNRAGLKKVVPPPPPALKAVSTPSGIALSWRPAAYPAGRIEGYNIYRKRQGEGAYISPLNGAPLQGAAYEDAAVDRGLLYRYVVRTVAIVEGETVESEISNEVEGGLAEPD